jgi:hypothetical protein
MKDVMLLAGKRDWKSVANTNEKFHYQFRNLGHVYVIRNKRYNLCYGRV